MSRMSFVAVHWGERAFRMVLMADKKPKSDRHKRPGFSLRLHAHLLQQLDLLVEQNATNRTTEISRALRELLVREGFWPIPKK